MIAELTVKQKEVLDFVKEHISLQGYPPSIREICYNFGFSSPMSAKQHLDALQRKGFIKRAPLKQRSIEVCKARPSNVITIPVIGKIRAGQPILASEEIESYINIDPALFRNEHGFALRVVGDSMIEAGIFEGDVAVIETESEIKNSDIVVALIDNEATIKRFYKKQRKIVLAPENSSMEPMVLKPSDVKILGKVRLIFRKL